MKQWYCWIEGQQYGPADLNELRNWVQEGRLHPGDFVWCEGMADWTTAAALPELFPTGYQAAAPAPGALAPTMPAEQLAPGAMPLPQPVAAQPGRGLCIASFVLGLMSMPCICCYLMGGVLGLVGLILGIIGVGQAKRANAPYGMGTAGIILSIVGMLLALAALIAVIVVAIRGEGPPFADPKIFPDSF